MARESYQHGRKHKIRGDLRPFRIGAVQELRKQILNGQILFNNSVQYRNIFKQLIADRIRVALRQTGQYRPLPETDRLLEAMQGRPRLVDLCDFVSCTLEYYNVPELCEYRIAIPSRARATKQRVQNKVVTDALKGIQREFYVNVRPVWRMLEKHQGELAEDQMAILGKYRTMSRAVGLIYHLFRFLYLRGLPKKLTNEVYDQVWHTDRRVGNFYRSGDDGYFLIAEQKKHVVACIGERAAMVLYIQLLS